MGSKGGATKDEDFIEYIYPASMHNYMLFFTQKGRCYWLKVYDIPEGSKISKGRAIQNMLNIDASDKINAFIRVKNLQDPAYNQNHYLVFCTKQGVIKKTSLSAYSHPRQNGVNAITIREDDQVIQVRLTDGNSEIVIANREGRAIRFSEAKVRGMGRNATGVKAMKLNEKNGDEVVGMVTVSDKKETILVVSEKGYGKRSMIDELDENGNIKLDEQGQPVSVYRVTNRGGKGVKTMNITDKTGKLVAIKLANDDNDIMIINKSGMTIRMHVSDIRVMGRATQGVRLINLEKRNDAIAAVCKVDADSEEEVEKVDGAIDETIVPDEPIEIEEDIVDDDVDNQESDTENDE
jgi:DNA gyrase subunit A